MRAEQETIENRMRQLQLANENKQAELEAVSKVSLYIIHIVFKVYLMLNVLKCLCCVVFLLYSFPF